MNQVVSFKRYVNQGALENTLKEYYARSCQRTVETVTFDFNSIELFDPFPLSLTILWMLDLLEHKKQVSVILPKQTALTAEESPDRDTEERLRRRIQVFSHFTECRFTRFLLDQGILHAEELLKYRSSRGERKEEDRISPLVFLSVSNDLDEFLGRLTPHATQPAFEFGPALDLAVVKSGEIRNVVFRELGDNVFDHGSAKFGHLLMAFTPDIGGTPTEREDRFDARMKGLLPCERPFLKSLGGGGYLTVIVADKGPGFESVLRAAYLDDPILASKRQEPATNEIVDYAFMRHSTSKARDRRLAEFRSIIEKYQLPTLPATGLHWVREVAKAYRGLVSIRTGATITVYDFLSFPDVGHPESGLLTQAVGRREGLAEFGGVQIKLLFPTRIPHTRQPVFFFPGFAQRSGTRSYEYLPLSSDGLLSQEAGSEAMALWLTEKLEELHRAAQVYDRPKIILLDFCDWDPISTGTLKAFYLFMVEVMRIQNNRLACIVVDASSGLARITNNLAELSASVEGLPKERALCAIDLFRHSTLAVFGLGESDSLALGNLMSSPNPRPTLTSLSPTTLRRLEPLVEEDRQTGQLRLLTSSARIRKEVRKGIKARLAKIIVDANNGIYHQHGCYLIPSGAFAEGYVELRHLFNDVSSRRAVLRWIRLLLDTESATVLLSLGRGPLSLAQDLYDAHRDIQHVHITDASEPYEVLKASLLPKDTRVIVLVDVIGTQRSLNGLLEGCQHLNIVHLIGVVDSRYEAEEKSVTYLGKQYGLETIVRLPIRFWYEDKPPHYRYEQIIRVDPLSNAPITEPFLAEQPIWKTLNVVTGENTLLTEALADGSAIMVGHFENNDRHILYLFSTSRLAELYGTAIADTIRVDFTSYVDRDPALRELGDVKILYPKFTPGAEAIAQQISAALRYCPVIGLSSRQVRAAGLFGPKREAFRHVIIFDDASTTGTTLRHMLDLAERNGARTVFMYILCNRAETADARFLKNIQLYGRSKVHVRYLSDLPIPTYSRTQCPICRRAALYVQLKSELHDCPRVVYAIDELLLDLQKHPVDMLLDPTFALTYLSTPVPERLLMWELRSLLELAKQSVPVRKRLADVARDLHDVNSHALYLIRVIAAEEASFTEDERFMKEVFYESFRKALVTACRFYLKDRSSLLTTNDLAALLTVGRMFNRSFVAEQFEELERYWASEQNLMIMVVQLLLSVDRRTDIARVRDALRNIPTEHRSATIETLVQYFAGRAERATASHATLTAYQACIMRLADHGKLASLFAAIDPEKLSTLNSTKLSEIVEKYWREASSLIASDILPPIRVLTESGMAKSVCEDLRQVLLKVTALVKNTEELAGFVVNPRDSNVNRSIALDGFQRGVVEVQTILLEEEALSVPTLMLRLRAELGRIVVRVLDGYSARFAHDGVVVKYSPPSDSVFVLGHESDIFTILRNLIENVLLRAFESTHSVTPREAEIAIHGTEGDLDIALSVSDNGKGVPVNLKYGAGLSTIDEIVRKIGSKWSVGPRIDGRLGTYANVVFYRLPKR